MILRIGLVQTRLIKRLGLLYINGAIMILYFAGGSRETRLRKMAD